MPVLKRTFDKVDADIDKLGALVAGRRARVAAIGTELQDLEATAGATLVDAELEDGDATFAATAGAEIVAHMTALRNERSLSERAIVEAIERRCEYQLERWALEADELRKQAAALRKRAAKHREKTRAMLADLERHEECAYEPAAPPISVLSGNIVGGNAGVVEVPTPRSDRWDREADALEAQAAELERRQVPKNGAVTGTTPDELLAAIDALGVVRSPDPADIRAWAARVTAPHEPNVAAGYDRFRAVSLEGAVFHYELCWRAGAIDEAASKVRVITREDRVAQARMHLAEFRRPAWIRDRREELLAKGIDRDEAQRQALAEVDAWEKREREQIEREVA